MAKLLITEEYMVESFIKSNYYKTSKLIKEVPVYSRCVDLVVYNEKKNTISAIEFKTKKWRDAIKQALVVSVPFDYIEICVLTPKTEIGKEHIINECLNHGVGLYFMNEAGLKIKHILKPKRTPNLWRIQKGNIIRYIEEIK